MHEWIIILKCLLKEDTGGGGGGIVGWNHFKKVMVNWQAFF
jgi:hypothetical protein